MEKHYSPEEQEKLKQLDMNLANTKVTIEKLDSYFKITAEAFAEIKKCGLDEQNIDKAKDFLLMAESYFSDAKYFTFEKKDFVLAFGALNYAHAWLDAGARLGFFKVKNSRLFTVDDE